MELQLHRDFLLHRDHVPWTTFSGGGGVCSSCRRSQVSPKKSSTKEKYLGLPPMFPNPIVPKMSRLEEELGTTLPVGVITVDFGDIDTDAGLMAALTHNVPRHRYSSNTVINAKQTLEEYAQTKYGKAYEKLSKSEKGYLIALYRLNHFGIKH